MNRHRGQARSRAAGLAMAFKLSKSTQARWRAGNAPHLVALVRAGATFIGGQLVERPRERVVLSVTCDRVSPCEPTARRFAGGRTLGEIRWPQ
ncbi:hypothetical protein FMEAI12_4020074 [Parafrankia sp. Ea1.12]|nr:hypothetical protein FMEAI12_4020074 [Parafrankia sp. Ea1.12]